jgi:predicted negative regulator of RcsB-dependent stress response
VAQHISRKDLKKDEIRDTLVHGVESIASHQQLMWTVIGVAIVVALAVFGWSNYTQRQTAKAAAQLDGAMKTFQAQIRVPGETPTPDELTYSDDKNKFSDAEKKFLVVASQYGRTRPGEIARYYAGLSEIKLKKFADAENNLKQMDSSGDPNLAALAKFQLAGVYDQQGKAAEAAQLYQQLADKPTVFVPKALALLTLADHYSKSDPAQATKLYNQVKLEFPDAAQQADQGLELLNTKPNG